MKFSIVTISYNQAPFLERAINSVLEQRDCRFEYIVADGGSTDGSLQIIRKYDNRLAAFLPGPDQGPADALNRAFARASGDILGFLNSDDVLLPGALAAVQASFERRPEAEFVSGHCIITDTAGREIRRAYSDRFDLRRFAYGGCIVFQPATFFRRSLFLRTSGFNLSNRVSWDADLFFEFGLLGARHAVIPVVLAEYRVHSNSITGASRDEQAKQAFRDERLRRYLRREIQWIDRWWSKVYIYWRKVTNPRDTWNRIWRGSIGGQYRATSRRSG